MSVPNQLTIINKKKKDYKPGKFHTAPTEEVFKAMRELTPAGFALYYYFLKNSPDFELELYKVHFKEMTGYSDSAYDRALKELKTKGYLIQEKGTTWLFYP